MNTSDKENNFALKHYTYIWALKTTLDFHNMKTGRQHIEIALCLNTNILSPTVERKFTNQRCT